MEKLVAGAIVILFVTAIIKNLMERLSPERLQSQARHRRGARSRSANKSSAERMHKQRRSRRGVDHSLTAGAAAVGYSAHQEHLNPFDDDLLVPGPGLDAHTFGDNLLDPHHHSMEHSIRTDSSLDDTINPANGLPMINGSEGLDIEGNPYGTDSSHDDSFSAGSGVHDW